MNTAVINIKTEPKIKRQAQKVVTDLGLTLSAVLNGYLRHIIQTKTIHFSLNEEPTPYLLNELRLSEEERRAGRYTSFQTPGDELRFLDTMIINERKRKATKR